MPKITCKETPCTGIAKYAKRGASEPEYCGKHRDKLTMIDLKHPPCIHAECTKRKIFGPPGGSPKYCGDHQSDEPGMENLNKNRCNEPKCTFTRIFGPVGGTAEYCSHHIKTGMVDLVHPMCEYDDCTTLATFGTKQGELRFCAKHMQGKMFDTKHKKCQSKLKCNENAAYGLQEDGILKYCREHADPKMINLLTTRCEVDECMASASHGVADGTRVRCREHATGNMIDLKKNECQHPLCESSAVFGFPNKPPEYCGKHADPKMVDRKSKKCVYNSKKNGKCMQSASYGSPKDGKIKYCATHAKKIEERRKKNNRSIKGLKDLKHKRCTYEHGCTSSRTFGFVGGEPLRCSKHIEKHMVNLKKLKCNYENDGKSDCDNDAHYGIPGTSPTKCRGHRVENMIKNSGKKCEKKIKGIRCRQFAIYGRSTPIHCETHAKNDEINLVEKNCKKCNLPFVLNEKSLCDMCSGFPKMRLAKQNDLMKYLDSVGLHGDKTDAMIDKGVCGKERPDRIFYLPDMKFPTKVIIIECDENQHKNITYDCEEKRMFNIGQNCQGPKVYFIRWNPDEYKSKKANESISKRYKTLSTYVKNMINDKIDLPNALVSVFYMYYDGWTGIQNESWKCVQKFD